MSRKLLGSANGGLFRSSDWRRRVLEDERLPESTADAMRRDDRDPARRGAMFALQDELYRAEDVLIDELRRGGLKCVETEEGESIYLRTQLDVLPERDPEALCKTLRADSRTAWFVRSVCDQELLAAWVRERLEEGNLPEEIAAEIRVSETRQLGVRSS